MKKGKCKYCGAPIHEPCARCDNCDFVWQEGFKAGIKDQKSRLKETLRTLIRLSD